MNVSRTFRLASVLLLGAAGTACAPGEDSRLSNLAVGISKDSALTVMGGLRPSRIDPYLISGQHIETLLYIRLGEEPVGTDTVPDRDRTPVVVVNGLVTGWGWAHWDSVASANNIPVTP